MTHGTGIFLSISEQKIWPHLSQDDHHRIHHQASCYLLIGDMSITGVSTPFSNDASPLRKQKKSSMIVTVVHVEVTSLACPLHKK
jgi:hypothetical protein